VLLLLFVGGVGGVGVGGAEEALDDPADESSLRSGASLREGTALSLKSGRE
jgi:hypothetical protein